MKKLALLISFVLSITIIVGCNNTAESNRVNTEDDVVLEQDKVSDEDTTMEQETESDNDTVLEQEGSDDDTVSGQDAVSNKDILKHEDYKGDWKLKVLEDEELYLMTALEDYYGATGVEITEINNNLVKGSIYSVKGAPSYKQANVTFEGEIEGGKLTAMYEDEGWLYTGSIEMTFADDRIVANIKRDKGETTPLWGIPEGKFTFIRPIKTKAVRMSDEEKKQLEQFLYLFSKDKIKPFSQEELSDEMIVNFVGVNIALGNIDISKYGDNIKEEEAMVIFPESIMNDLANSYFGLDIKEHKTTEITTYEDGFYIVPAMGGVAEYPLVQIKMKDTLKENTYYLVVDYIFEYPEEGSKIEYQYLVVLQTNGNYIINSIKEINDPIEFEMLNQFLDGE